MLCLLSLSNTPTKLLAKSKIFVPIFQKMLRHGRMSYFLNITSYELLEFGLRLGGQTAKFVCVFPGLCHVLKKPRNSRSREESFLEVPWLSIAI